MSEVISLIFSQQFLVRALIVGTLISLCAALLGVSLVLKRFSMIGDGLSHVGFGAMAIASAANIAPLYFSLPIVVVAAFLLLKMSEKGKIKGDAAIALISTGALAIGIMATSVTTGMNVDIYNYMFGSILTMSEGDVVISSVISVVIIALFVLLYNEIFAVTFDESFAKATGTKVSVYNMIISALTAVTIVIGMRMMGALLISSLIIFPTVTSMRVCKSYRGVVICSTAVSVFCFLSGLFLSIRHETPTGASVVVVNIFMLGVFALLGAVSNIPRKSRFCSVKKLLKAAVCTAAAVMFIFAMTFGSFNVYKKDKLTIVATSFAPYDFARQIAGDKAEIIMLLAPGEESHTYEPTPGDIMKIEQCDVFIYGGGESEHWVDSVLDGIDSEIRTVKMMDCVSLYEHEEHEGHSHEESEEEHAEYDEHVWTSPMNAIIITEAICAAICEADADNREEYSLNAESFIRELRKLDGEFNELMSRRIRNYIVIGDRFPLMYFTKRYSLEYFAAFPGCSAQAEANPVTVANLCNKVKNESVPVVFKIDLSTGLIAKSISEQTGASVEILYSCHVISAEDFNTGETYLSLMYRNLHAIEKALLQ